MRYCEKRHICPYCKRLTIGKFRCVRHDGFFPCHHCILEYRVLTSADKETWNELLSMGCNCRELR